MSLTIIAFVVYSCKESLDLKFSVGITTGAQVYYLQMKVPNKKYQINQGL